METKADVISNAVLIAGPTASGKSSYAFHRAERALAEGVSPLIINADSMQVYGGLRLLTARPSAKEEAQIPHRLYGHIDPAIPFSTGDWLRQVAECLDGLPPNTLPIFVGGTGLYFKALSEGFAKIPEIPDEIRQRLRSQATSEGLEALYQDLSLKDPDYAALIEPTDGQRIVRALEVLAATGKSILQWREESPQSPLLAKKNLEKTILLPERALLYQRINERFQKMIENGAIKEVETLLARKLAADLPVMKAIGVREIAAYLEDEISLEEAIDQASRESRRYAKRQMTFLRNQMGEDWHRITP